ncbi:MULTISPECIES: hypothetical protein [unclassified Frankia]|uniref:hypothetical protein n=1 Tax=unclassified Frankia TaxID=2632575 RepID=UPI001EF40500|nr:MULTISPECIES: hypothetical protein [unclassified Frankia]
MARFSPAYREYMSGPRWRERKEQHWRSRWTVKSCIVCGARRGERSLDIHHLAYRNRRDGSMADPRRWELVPACAHPCHRWVITPLSRAPYVRAGLFTVLAVVALWYGAPVVPTAAATVAALALPRIPEATFLAFVLGLPVRLVRAIGRLIR